MLFIGWIFPTRHPSFNKIPDRFLAFTSCQGSLVTPVTSWESKSKNSSYPPRPLSSPPFCHRTLKRHSKALTITWNSNRILSKAVWWEKRKVGMGGLRGVSKARKGMEGECQGQRTHENWLASAQASAAFCGLTTKQACPVLSHSWQLGVPDESCLALWPCMTPNFIPRTGDQQSDRNERHMQTISNSTPKQACVGMNYKNCKWFKCFYILSLKYSFHKKSFNHVYCWFLAKGAKMLKCKSKTGKNN